MKSRSPSRITYDSNISRRELLKRLGMGLVGTALGGCSSKPTSSKTSIDVLRLYGTGTLDIEDWSRARSDINVDLHFKDNGNDTGPVITQMITGTAADDYDLGGLQGGAEAELAKAKTILPWDLTKLPNWENVWPIAKRRRGATADGKQYGLPIAINADSMIYLPDKVGTIDSYAAVFDPKLKGKTSMEDAWINSVIFTAIYMKGNALAKIIDPGNLTPEELGQVMEFLIKMKRDGQFHKFWSGWEDGVQLLKSGTVVVMTGWEPIVYALRKDGINAEYAVPKEGYEGWSNDLILHTGAEKRKVVDAAHRFANWELGGYYGCRLSQMRGYVVPTDAASKYAKAHEPEGFDPDSIQETAERVLNKFNKQGGDTYWQTVRPDHVKLYEDWWSKLRSA